MAIEKRSGYERRQAWRPLNRKEESPRSLIIFLIVMAVIGLALMFVHAADIDYNPPVTQAEDTAAEMGRQNDAQNQATLDRENEEWKEEQQAERDRQLQEQIDKLQKEQNDNSRNVH